MSKLPPIAGVTTPAPRSVGGKVPQTRATTAALAAISTMKEQTAPAATHGEGDVNHASISKIQSSSAAMSQAAAYSTIAEMLNAVIQSGKLDAPTKQSLVKVLKVAREAETNEKNRVRNAEEQMLVSDIRAVMRKDLVEIHDSLAERIRKVKEDCGEILGSTTKVLKEVEEAKTDTRDLTSKVNKVTDAADKIASDTNSYRDVLLSKPTPSNRSTTDPRVISNMDRRAKQILVDIYDKDGNNILTKSLTAIIEKANEAISGIQDAKKPKDIKVIAALKTRGQAILLTLNSSEAVKWIREPGTEVIFAEEFSTEAHIRERAYSLIVPRVPVTFEPSDDKHLREMEEANSLDKNTIRKARWIKPLERRRPEQTHAYAIITLISVDSANILIRDGLVICGTKVRPTKQKHKPMQCMKCRKWGHLAAECPSDKDVCGNCGEEHRTSMCKKRSQPYCVACKEDTHASWSRNCPEFIRRCMVYDERNPENSMPYFPTEHDWSLTVRPYSIPLAERFPAKYAVNALPTMGGRQQAPRPRQPYKTQKRGKRGGNDSVNPNTIQIQPRRPREEGELPSGAEWWQMDAVTGAANTDETTPHEPTG